MMRPKLFAYDFAGRSIALADGRDLLIHDGQDESPRWRKTGEADWTMVGLGGGQVIAADAEGRVFRYDEKTGAEAQRIELGVPIGTGTTSDDGVAWLLAADQVIALSPDGTKASTPVVGPTAIAVAPSGARAVAEAGGRLLLQGQEAEKSLELGGPIQSVAWHPRGFWLAAVEDRLLRVDATTHLVEPYTRASGSTITAVACNPDTVALVLDEKTAVALSHPSKDTRGNASYFDRKIIGVALGPAPWLGVGLDLGDGNKIDLATGAVCRTDTHPGRDHHRWMLQVSVGAPPQEETRRGPLPTAPAGAGAGAALRAEKKGSLMLPLVLTAFLIALWVLRMLAR